jgi:orotate phosphoribosyltransferase
MPDELMSLIAGRRGHFQLESGYHAEMWFELGRLFDQPARLQPFVAELATRLAARGIDAICGPAIGGAKLAALIAQQLQVESYFTERTASTAEAGLFPVRYDLPVEQRRRIRGKRVAVVDDAISAGSAVRGTFAQLLSHGARPVAVGALIVFGNTIDSYLTEHALSVDALTRMDFALWRPAECPRCHAGEAFERITDQD